MARPHSARLGALRLPLQKAVTTRHIVIALIAVVVTASLVACQAERGIGESRLKLAGSTTVEPVARSAAKAFMSRYPGSDVSVRGGGSTIGVMGAGYGALQIGMGSRPLKKEELEKWPRLAATVVGRDGVAVVVNRALYDAGVKQLTLEQVAGIWLGKVTNWKDVGGPDLPLKAFDKELGRGTRDTFAKVVLGAENAPAPGTVGALGENEAVLSAVAEDKSVVSILSTGWQTAQVVGVTIVGKDGQAVPPTTENVAAGRYPISRDLIVITDGPPRGLAEAFIRFMLSPEGQGFVKEQGYTPITR